MKRVRFSCALAVLVGCAFALGGCGKPSVDSDANASAETVPRTAIRFQTDWYPQPEHGGFYQALARGFYAEARLDVSILPGGPGPKTTAKIAGGSADVAMGRSDDILRNIDQGLPFVIVGVFMQHDPQALLLHTNNPVSSFSDLDGRTVMAIPGSNWIAFLKVRYQIDFNIIPTNFGLAQFMADPGFIQQCFVTNEPFFAAQNGAQTKVLLLADTGFDPYRVIYTTRRFLRENPAAVQAFVAASTRGWRDYIEGDPAAANALLQARNDQLSDAFIAFSIATMRERGLVGGHPDQGETYGDLRRERIAASLNTMRELGLIESALKPEDAVSFPTAGQPTQQ